MSRVTECIPTVTLRWSISVCFLIFNILKALFYSACTEVVMFHWYHDLKLNFNSLSYYLHISYALKVTDHFLFWPPFQNKSAAQCDDLGNRSEGALPRWCSGRQRRWRSYPGEGQSRSLYCPCSYWVGERMMAGNHRPLVSQMPQGLWDTEYWLNVELKSGIHTFSNLSTACSYAHAAL